MAGLVSRATWIAVAAEAVSGTAEAAPKVYIPVELGGGISMKPVILKPKDTRGSRAATTARRQGVKAYPGKFKGTYFNDATSALLRSALGADTISQPSAGPDPTVYDHAMKLANTSPISQTLFYNIWQATGFTESYAWTVIDKFKLSYKHKDSLLLWEMDTLSMKFAYLAGAVPTPTWTTLLPHAGWEAQVTKGAGLVAGVTEAEIEITNDYEEFYGSVTTTVQQEPTEMMPGDHEVKGKCTILATRAQYELFTADTEEVFQLVFVGETISSTFKQTITFNITKARYEGGERDNGEKVIMLKCEFEGVLDGSTSTVATATIRNNRALTYY